MNRLSSVRVRLVAIVFLAVAPALALLIFTGQSWIGLVIGLLAAAAAWVGGEWFILRKVKAIIAAAKGLAAGDWSTRVGLEKDPTELGELARIIDQLAASLEKENKEGESSSRSLLNQAHQQTVVAALGQYTLSTADIASVFNQAMMLVGQTLEVEYCKVLELVPETNSLLLTAGLGWKKGYVGLAEVDASRETQAGYTLATSEPVVVRNVNTDPHFKVTPFYVDHGVVSSVTVAIHGHGGPSGVLGVDTTTEREFSEEEVHFLLSIATVLAMAIDRRRSEPEFQKLAAFAKVNPNPVLEFSNEGELVFFNDATQKMAEQLGEYHPKAVLPPDTYKIVQSCLATGKSRLHLETRQNDRILSWSFYPILASNVLHCYVEDITERSSLESQLRQAQKMESVGQLAAGVAHDFNNILTIIQGHSGLLMSRPDLPQPVAHSVQSISFAAERATSLTRQLLMFSRKQVMQPRSLGLGAVVSNLDKMLQRLLGETVSLNCRTAEKLPRILADSGMMEQVLMNLAVNARDAMPKGGSLAISTDPVQIDEDYVNLHADARAGLHVCLQVTDTGCGMDEATIKRIFEPFFTTKEAGKGTGLGLATVYGIVRQHSGWVEVSSELGKGTTFKIYLPAIVKTSDRADTEIVAKSQARGGTETILVVEDEPVLRELAQAILQDFGYTVFEAGSGVEALSVWDRNGGKIDLLLTDMIMPEGLSGTDLADSLLAREPKLRVILTSGYNLEEIGMDVSRLNGSRFLQKPYSRSTLAVMVRECLDAPCSEAPVSK